MSSIPRPILALLAATALAAAGCSDDDGCESPEPAADALIASYAACSVDEDCEVINLFDIGLGSETCIAAFQCDAALNVDADHEQLAAEAQAMVDEYMSCEVVECAHVECVPWEFEGTPVGACDTATSTCEIDVIPL